MPEYRIEYAIQRSEDGEEDFTEIGFGSSGSWSSVEQAAEMLSADVQHRQWETQPGQPDPEDVDRHA